MSAADRATTEVDDRLRAALLWDRPRLNGFDDLGARQWRDALGLNFTSFGELVGGDTLSQAAHVLRATLLVEQASAAGLREGLRAQGGVGQLFERLIELSMGGDEPSDKREALVAARELVDDLEDEELRARLLVRLVGFAESAGARDLAAVAADGAVGLTSADTRIGVVARRWAAAFGRELTDFKPYARTDTPEDPLLALPWVQRTVIDATTSIEVDRVDRRLAGVWDSSFVVGRTKFDDMLAAHVQVEWCGALDLRSDVRKLLSAQLLTEPGHDVAQIRWALQTWASEPGTKRVAAAVRRMEGTLDAQSAAELFITVRRDPRVSEDAAVDVAVSVWDLVDDAMADALIDWLATVEAQRSGFRRDHALSALLWRRPATWYCVFASGDDNVRARMLGALDPHDLEAATEELLRLLAEYAERHGRPASERGDAVRLALRHAVDGTPLRHRIDPSDAIQLLEWRRFALAIEAIASSVAELAGHARDRLERAAEGSYGIGTGDTGQMLGRLASYLPVRQDDVVRALLDTCRSAVVPGSWQFGALEGLSALRRAGLLFTDDLEEVRALELQPGQDLLGERVGPEALRANQLRVLGAELDESEVTWLAACARASDVRARLVAIHALEPVIDTQPSTVDWSLVGGLFDPSDDVTLAAVGVVAQRGLTDPAGPTAVARDRVAALASGGGMRVRRAAVMAAMRRPDLQLQQVVDRARSDRSWTVRHEAERGASGERP